MKQTTVPEFVDSFKSSDRALTYEGIVSFAQLPRFMALQSSAAKEDAEVDVSFQFSRDEQKLSIVSMSYLAVATMTCQRCLNSLDHESKGRAVFVFCRHAAHMTQMPKRYEPVLVEANLVNLWQLLEDELLLSLPMFAKHPDRDCNGFLSEFKAGSQGQQTEKPFAGLGELLKFKK